MKEHGADQAAQAPEALTSKSEPSRSPGIAERVSGAEAVKTVQTRPPEIANQSVRMPETLTDKSASPASPEIADQIARVLEELAAAGSLRHGRLIVVGASTSEVQGQHIGTSGAENVAAQLFEGVNRVSRALGLAVVWQCCEHLNRALACERALAEAKGWTIVSAVPVAKAGGSMAAYAYRQMQDPCLVENVQADAGIDIGETMIGMHLRAVAVPFRPSVRWIGEARVGAAYCRPKLIGGSRAVYEQPVAAENTNHACN